MMPPPPYARSLSSTYPQHETVRSKKCEPATVWHGLGGPGKRFRGIFRPFGRGRGPLDRGNPGRGLDPQFAAVPGHSEAGDDGALRPLGDVELEADDLLAGPVGTGDGQVPHPVEAGVARRAGPV